MKIAVASGKGGTGKTTVATNLAYLAAKQGHRVAYLDCDVEEPNGAIFLRPKIIERHPVGILSPKVDESKCTACGKCGEICQYSAILCLGKKVLTFPQMCHGCGGCTLVCPAGAITEELRETGRVDIGQSGRIHFVQGELRVGEAMSPPVIREVKALAPAEGLVLMDAPPGTSCPVIETVRGADLVLLVTEPTPFGLHDLQLAVEMVRSLSLSFGVVINRCNSGRDCAAEYCSEESIEVLAEIPEDRWVAEKCSEGRLASEVSVEFGDIFRGLLDRIMMTEEDPAPSRAPRRRN